MNIKLIISQNLQAPQGVDVRKEKLAVCDTGHHQLALYDINSLPEANPVRIGGLGIDPGQEGMRFPAAVCFIGDNEILVADTQNRHLDHYKLQAGDWVFQQSLAKIADGTVPLGFIVDVIEDGTGKALALDASEKRILHITPSNGIISEYFRDAQWEKPSAITLGGGYLWVADSFLHKVFRYDVNALFSGSIAIGHYGRTSGSLCSPNGLTTQCDDSGEYLYISERDTARISKFTFKGQFVAAFTLPTGTVHEPHKLIFDGDARLYLADAAANAVYVIQVSGQDVRPSLDQSEIDFGCVGVGYHLTESILIRNGSNSSIEVTSMDVVGGNFSIVEEALTPPFTLPPGDEQEILIDFQPAEIGLTAGEFKISLDLISLPYMRARLTGEGMAVEPVSLALVLDRSGSMGQPSGIMSKIERVCNTAELVGDLMRPGSGDQLAAVSFSDNALADFPFETVTEQSIENFKSIVRGITPGGMTSIGSGLQLAAEQINGLEYVGRPVMIVLSDGKENTAPMISDAVIDPETQIFTIGLGLPEYLDSENLINLASVSGGYFQVTDANDHLLPKFFTQILSDLFNYQIAIDPAKKLKKGEIWELPVDITDEDIEIMTVLTCENGDSSFELEYVAPREYVVKNSDIKWISKGNQLLVASVSLRKDKSHISGKWTIRTTCKKAAISTELCVATVLLKSNNQFDWSIAPIRKTTSIKHSQPHGGAGTYRKVFPSIQSSFSVPTGLQQGDSIRVTTKARQPNSKIKFVYGEAILRKPVISLTKLKEGAKDIDLDKLKDYPPKEEDVSAKQITRRSAFLISKYHDTASVVLDFDGPDGIYEILLRVCAETQKGNRFTREKTMFIFIAPDDKRKLL